MKTALTATVVVILFPVLLLADPALIVDGDRLLLSQGDGTVASDIGPASLLQNIHYMPGTTPTDPDEPTDPPEDPAARVDRIKELSKDVNDSAGAAVLSAVVGTVLVENDFGTSAKGKQAWDSVMVVTIEAINGAAEPRWNEWRPQVEALSEGSYDNQFFRDAESGLVLAYDLNQAAIAAMSALVAAGDDAETAAAAMAVDYGEAFDWKTIFELIVMILNLLRDLGIL